MNNLHHYIESIRQGESYFSFERKSNIIAYMLAAIHFITCIIFALIPLITLSIINGCFGVFYVTIVRNLIKQHKYTTALYISLLEVLLISFFETFCLGLTSGFILYNISMISAIFYFTFVMDNFKKKEIIPLVFSLFCVASYCISYLLMQVMEPVYLLEESHWPNILHIFNALVTFAFLILFSFLFIWEIKANQGKLASQNKQLHEIAHKDPLTRLMNRRNMNQILQQEMDQLKSTGKRFSLILGDIDDFKKVNDTYGHDVGDYVLVTVSEIISNSVREGDAVCRWGGEEILILVHDPLGPAANAAERIRKNIADYHFHYEGHDINVTMTFGVSESIPGYRLDALVQQADEHLYTGKKSGKNIVVFQTSTNTIS
ncbi:MAG: GGDEF domain-containing protein [Lachnospiraceae bacterium]|nr:GGDEF domain-containing protein [Lachnospiraceae bacterium]